MRQGTMVDSAVQFQTKVLRRRQTPEQYRLYRAALEWGLRDPALIAGDTDLRSAQQWKGRVEPQRHHLRNLMAFCNRLPATLIADEIGLGSIVSAGLLASEL